MREKKLVFIFLLVALVALCTTNASAEELRYRPINPAFGGNPLNAGYLLQTAEAQKKFQAPDNRESPLERFSGTVQNAILSKVSQEIADSILGEDARNSGNFQLGELNVSFERQGDEVLIEVAEAGKTGSTEIRVPAPTF